MTALHIRQCPRCELRFTSSSELDYHLANDHRPRPAVDDAPPTTVRTPLPPPDHPSQATVNDLAPVPRSGVSTWIVTLASLLLITLAGWIGSIPTALITAGLVVILVACYRWRHTARTSLLRRQPIRQTHPVNGEKI
jgi:uncharacterized membrane protein YccC